MEVRTELEIMSRTEGTKVTWWWRNSGGGDPNGPFDSKVEAIDAAHAASVTEAERG